MKIQEFLLIALYLIAITTANLAVTMYGPGVSVITAFLWIGLDLTSKDKLQDIWQGHLVRNMALLILTGGLISFLINSASLVIAVASVVAFTVSLSLDALVYQYLKNRPWFERSNLSNIVASVADSLIFPVLAFGFPVLWGIVFGQAMAKIAGGFMWSLLFGFLNKEEKEKEKEEV